MPQLLSKPLPGTTGKGLESNINKNEHTEDTISITDDVRAADYYHGLVPRTDVEPLLKKEGDFLLRKTEHTPGIIVLAISMRVNSNIKHYMINQGPNGTFYLEGHHENSISELINWHRTTKVPLSSNAANAILKRPVERPAWLLNHDSITLVKKLGEGAFGEVFLAEFSTGEEKQEVAVKTMRNEPTREARLKFMKEARLMRKYNHRHVVKILGVAVHENPLMLVMEVCPGGSLLSYLRKNKGKTGAAQKLRFSTEAADGLWYLEKQCCIHRDIAARNCLLSAKTEVKIADFGMSDDKKIVHDDTLDKVPVKWLSPETLQGKVYSLKTDIWSYGVLVWEVYMDGAEPYPGLSNIQTRAKVVVQNYRMEMPKECPTAVAKVVYACWDKDPKNRPEMGKIFRILKEVNMRTIQSVR